MKFKLIPNIGYSLIYAVLRQVIYIFSLRGISVKEENDKNKIVLSAVKVTFWKEKNVRRFIGRFYCNFEIRFFTKYITLQLDSLTTITKIRNGSSSSQPE